MQFIKAKGPDERVFGLSPESLGMKVKQLAMKAGLSGFHAHTLRHKFATDVLESGTNVKVLQFLMGHANLQTTQVYLSVRDKRKREAIDSLDDKPNNEPTLDQYYMDGLPLQPWIGWAPGDCEIVKRKL